jgi:hypothetical protein
MIYFSIITPSLLRPSLIRTCESIDAQAYPHWEHLIFVDRAIGESDFEAGFPPHPERFLIANGFRCSDFGNTPRRLAWRMATGTYCIWIDDDNYLSDPFALARLAAALVASACPLFALVPCLRCGQRFFSHPPAIGATDTANLVVCRDLAEWPDKRDYDADGQFAEFLHARYGSVALDIDPVIVVPMQQQGRAN